MRRSWKYYDERYVCGEVDSEKHVLLDCNLYMDERRRWKGKFVEVHANLYVAIKGFEMGDRKINYVVY